MSAHAETQYGSKVIASDRNNYWRYYGLHRDPFMPIVEDSNFFLPVRWEQYFDLLQYLCQSSNVLLSVIGVKGSGKTTFMRQFAVQASDTAKISRLVGSTVLTPSQLSKALIKDFTLPNPTGETSEEQWESLCHSLQSGTQPYLLVIDDAHRLPQETLSVILGLIKQQSEHQMRLHVLLIGETQLTGMLNALKEAKADHELIHTVVLEALSLQDTEAYIKHRLLAAGLPGGMPLHTTDVARIYKLSEGVPGRINAVARQVLIDVMQQRQLYGFSHFISTRRTQILGGVVILAVLTALALFLTRGEIAPAYKLHKLIARGKTTEMVNITNNTAASDKTMMMPTANANQIIQLNTKDNSSKTVDKNDWYAAGMVQFKSLNSKQPEKTTASQPTATQQSMATNITATTDKLLTPASPLLSNPKHFTLQLVGVSSEASVEHFISKNQLADQAYYYHAKLRNKNWYVVVYGDYASKQDAAQALANLPESVRSLHPWARTMENVLASVQRGQEASSQIATTVQTTASPVQSTSTEATTGKP